MIALIEGQSTISYVITLGIPIPDHLGDPEPTPDTPDQPGPDQPDADAAPPDAPADPGPADPDPADPDPADPSEPEPVAHPDPAAEEPAADEAGPAPDTADITPQAAKQKPGREPAAACQGEDPLSERTAPHQGAESDAERPVSTRGEDSVAERPAERGVSARGERTVAEVVAAALAALARHGETDIEITGAGNPQPTDVNAAWVADALAQAARDGQVRLAAVHPQTGALIDPHNAHTTTAYVPGKALTQLVKARDGRCRFPGCTLNVRFTDLDHTRPWPAGTTSADNLHSLCRRHHRIKQLVGWHVALRPDGTTLWVDPLGRRYLTRALDHRGRPQTPPTPAPPARSLEQQAADQAARDKAIAHALRKEGPVSILEEHLSHEMFDHDQEANRHAIRTGTPRPWREQVPFDIRYHAPSGKVRLGKVRPGHDGLGHNGLGHNRAGRTDHGQTRHVVLDLPEGELVRRPGRPQYDEPPF